jgi:hypothetical protein
MQTFDWGWKLFNHRVSTIAVDVEPAQVAIVGGTSTTGVPRDLDPSCDPDACREFPFKDLSAVELGVGAATTSDASFAVGRAEGLATAAGVTVELRVDAPDRDGDITAVLSGFRVDTDHPLDGPSACYDPAFGWHPTRLAVRLDDPRREGDELVVDVTLTFGAGNAEDPDRVCIDEVNELALVPMSADVLFIIGATPDRQGIAQDAYFPFSGDSANPGEQVVPPGVALDAHAPGLRGWSRFDWSFNPDSDTGRGAYLRTLSLRIDDETASGTATNYSPVTQLDDFGFVFDGEVVHVAMSGVSSSTLTATDVPAALDDVGEPVMFPLGE